MRTAAEHDPARRPFAIMFVAAMAITAVADVVALRGGHTDAPGASAPALTALCEAQMAAVRGDVDLAIATFRQAEPAVHQLVRSLETTTPGRAVVMRQADRVVEGDVAAHGTDAFAADVNRLIAVVSEASPSSACER